MWVQGWLTWAFQWISCHRVSSGWRSWDAEDITTLKKTALGYYCQVCGCCWYIYMWPFFITCASTQESTSMLQSCTRLRVKWLVLTGNVLQTVTMYHGLIVPGGQWFHRGCSGYTIDLKVLWVYFSLRVTCDVTWLHEQDWGIPWRQGYQ